MYCSSFYSIFTVGNGIIDTVFSTVQTLILFVMFVFPTLKLRVRPCMQDTITAIERCRKPVIAAVHGACIGGGIDIITACDVRYCTESAFFSVKEVDLGITADLGTLQRLPSIVGYGKAVELALSARRFSGSEAKELGLVSRVFGSKDAMDEGVQAIAEGNFVFLNDSLRVF